MSDVNWWLMLLSFLLGAIITWFWMVRRTSREVPRTVVDRDLDVSGKVGGATAGVGAGVAGVAGAAAGAAALRDRDADVDLDVDDATTRRADLDLDRPTTELYDRTVDEPSTSWDAPDVNAPEVDAPDVDAPDVDAPTIQRSSLDVPDVDAADRDAGADGASFERDVFDVPAVAAPEVDTPDTGASEGLQDKTDWDIESADVDAPDLGAPDVGAPGFGGAGVAGGVAAAGAAGVGARFAGGLEDTHTSSDAEIIEAESDLETPAAPTGEADWDSSDTGEDTALDRAGSSDVGSSDHFGLDSAPPSDDGTAVHEDLGTSSDAPTDGPATSVMPMRDAGDLAAAQEPVVEVEPAGATPTDVTPTAAGAAGAGGAAFAEGRFGKGSAEPGADGSGPSGWAIKGNEDSMLFHTEDSPSYKRTKAEVWFEDEGKARKAGFTKWNEKDRSGGSGGPAKLVEIPEGRFGKGSAEPGADGSGPSGWAIKGNEDSMLFHTEDSPSYKRTNAEVWFEDEETARKAGFTKWNERSR